MKLPFGFQLSRTKAAVGVTQVPRNLLGHVREPYAGAWQNGDEIKPLGAVTTFGAVFACITRIANDIAKLEPRLMSLSESGIWEPVTAFSPLATPLIKPNTYQNRIQFLVWWLVSKLLHGNTYAIKVRDQRKVVVALYIVDPRKVTPLVTPQGDVYYQIGGEDISKVGNVILPASEVIHDRGLTLWHPLMGVSPIYACATSASQGMRIQSNSNKFFENMSRPSGMLTAPGTIDDVTAERLKREWEGNYSGSNIGRLAVLGDGLSYEAMTIPADDAQLMEQLDWTVQDVARCFSMPLYKINAGNVPTAGNVEALESQYYSGCLQVLIESLELCLKEGLELPNSNSVEFDLDGLLRTDSATQIDMLAKAVGGAIMKPDEARKKRNLPPVPGGDTVYLQQQNYSLAALAKRDNSADPFGTAKPPAPAPAPVPAPVPPDDEGEELERVFQGFSLEKALEVLALDLRSA